MESVGSSSSSPPPNHRHQRFLPSRPVADRIFRALRHHLLLLHRSESNFFVLGATGNVYTVSLTATPSCTCPDRTTPCKHIFFVLIRVLGVPFEDHCLRRRTLRPCQVNRLLCRPTLQDAVAGAGLRERFHELFYKPTIMPNSSHSNSLRAQLKVEEGTTCPVCLEEIRIIPSSSRVELKGTRILIDEKGNGDDMTVVTACRTCKNVIHEECLIKWKRSRGRRGLICVICRSRWRDRIGGNSETTNNYLNLSVFVNGDVPQPDHGPCVP